MPIDPSISLQVQNPDLMNRISNLVNLKQAQVNLQTSQAVQPYEIERQKAVSQGTVLGLNQKVMQELQSHFTSVANGPIATKLADPQTPPDQIPALKQQLQSELDKHAGYAQAVLKGTGIDPSMAESQLRPFYDQLNNDPKNFQQFARDRQLAAAQQVGQINAAAPSGIAVDTGQQAGTINTNPYSGIGVGNAIPGTVVQKVVPPTATTVTPEGQPTYVGIKPQTSGSNIVAGAPPGQVENILQNTKETQAVRTSANQIPGIMTTIDNIKRLIGTDAKFGPGSDKWNSVVGMLNTATGGALGSSASSYQEAGAYLDRLALQQAQAMGQGSVAGLQMTAGATGTPTLTKEALMEKMNNTAALFEGANAYRQAMDRAIGTGPKQNFAAKNAFDSAWTKAYDQDLFRAKLAHDAGDMKDYKEIISKKPSSYWKQHINEINALLPGYFK